MLDHAGDAVHELSSERWFLKEPDSPIGNPAAMFSSICDELLRGGFSSRRLAKVAHSAAEGERGRSALRFRGESMAMPRELVSLGVVLQSEISRSGTRKCICC